MQTMRMTMAQALIRFIDQQYVIHDGREEKFVEGIFSIFGHGNVCGIGEALEYGEHDLKFMRGINEQGMAHAATAFAKQNQRRKIYAVTTSIGPGATNLVTAAATATINRIPLLLLPGDIFASRAPDPVLQQLENYGAPDISVNDSLRPVSRYFDRINRPEQLMSSLIKAFKVLTDPALSGAVTIALPQDVQCEAYDYPASFFAKRVHEIARVKPCENAVHKAAQIIVQAQRPLIIVGGGVGYSGAEKIVQQIAKEFSIPFAETQAGKGLIDASTSANLGGLGVIGTSAANKIARDADCVIAIGTRLGDFTTCSKTIFANDPCRLITVNVDQFDAIKFEPSVAVIADAKQSLLALYDELKKLGCSRRENYGLEIAAQKKSWLAVRDEVMKPNRDTDVHLDQMHVLGMLNELIDDNAVVVAAAGSLPGDVQRFWQSRSYKSYHLEYGYSCMGYEIAGALGVKMAEPSRQVWALVGDGSFLMMHSEIITAISENLKINILLFDNSGFACIKGLQCAMGSKGYGTDLRYRDMSSQKLDGKNLPIDFAMIGEGMGLKTYRPRNLDELAQHIKNAQSEERSTLIDVKIIPGSQSKGYDAWWNVAVSEVSTSSDVKRAHHNMAHAKERVRYW